MIRVLETALHAPSAHNRQPWRFAVLTQPHSKSRLNDLLSADFRCDLAADGLPEPEIEARLQRSRSRINEAPVVVILCMDTNTITIPSNDKRYILERTMAIQSVTAAGLQLQLAAHAEGLGSVWNCAPLFAPQAVQTALELPPNWEPQAMFLIGWPAETPRPKKIKPLDEIMTNLT